MTKRVVIVDDSALARMFLRRCLEIAGLNEAEFVEAADGGEALTLLKESPTDLLVTDLTMPDVDGLDLMRHIAASPRLFGTPVLVVTSAGNEAQREELLRLGAIRILTKPINPQVVSDALETIFPELGE